MFKTFDKIRQIIAEHIVKIQCVGYLLKKRLHLIEKQLYLKENLI